MLQQSLLFLWFQSTQFNGFLQDSTSFAVAAIIPNKDNKPSSGFKGCSDLDGTEETKEPNQTHTT